jgi:hypothetical protein
MPIIKKNVTEEQKAKWKTFCEDQGVSESYMLGKMIEKVTSGVVNFEKEKSPPLTTSEVRKITIRVSGSEYEAIENHVDQTGFENPTSWLTRFALSVLRDKYIITKSELITLRESNRELAAIGRNLNQIARAINIDFRESGQITKEVITELKKCVDENRDRNNDLIKKCLSRSENE